MSYKRTSPQPIEEGGTNATSMATSNGTVYFDGTRLVTTATGSSGFVLTSNGAAAPTFQASGGGGGVTGPGSSTNRSISTWNGTGGSALFDNPTTNINSSGIMTNTTQPSFLIYATQTSTTPVTGNNAAYLLLTANEGWTVLYDKSNSISTRAGGQIIITTPVAGTYLFTYNILLDSSVAASLGAFYIQPASGRTIGNNFEQNGSPNAIYYLKGSFIMDLPAGDITYFTVQVTGNGADDMSIVSSGGLFSSTYTSYVSGFLLC